MRKRLHICFFITLTSLKCENQARAYKEPDVSSFCQDDRNISSIAKFFAQRFASVFFNGFDFGGGLSSKLGLSPMVFCSHSLGLGWEFPQLGCIVEGGIINFRDFSFFFLMSSFVYYRYADFFIRVGYGIQCDLPSTADAGCDIVPSFFLQFGQCFSGDLYVAVRLTSSKYFATSINFGWLSPPRTE